MTTTTACHLCGTKLTPWPSGIGLMCPHCDPQPVRRRLPSRPLRAVRPRRTKERAPMNRSLILAARWAIGLGWAFTLVEGDDT